MISKLRVKLARWLIGSDPVRRMVVYGYGLAQFMTEMGASRVGFMTADGNFYTLEKKGAGEDDSLQLCCEVCTNVFAASPDKPARCPSCGSAHVTLAGGPEETEEI